MSNWIEKCDMLINLDHVASVGIKYPALGKSNTYKVWFNFSGGAGDYIQFSSFDEAKVVYDEIKSKLGI